MSHLFSQERPVMGVAPATAPQQPAFFHPLPKPTGKAPFHLDLKSILPAAGWDMIAASKRMIFHTCGDSGGVKQPADQQLVANHMEMQFQPSQPASNPSFFYHLGDVVYYYGKDAEYNAQFYEPYRFYPAPIFAIPGNHDGDVDPTDPAKPASLAAFVKLFCAKTPVVPPEAGDALRTTMVQPNVYWTLVTPVANIIGLYSNVVPGGEIHADQQKWFISELKAAGKEHGSKAIIVALHHQPYSMDTAYGSSVHMQQFLNDCFDQSGVIPDLVLSGHVHNYQRFTRHLPKQQLPYIVAGAGGYWFLHSLNQGGGAVITTPTAGPAHDVTFEKYADDRHGFLRLEIDLNKKVINGDYYTVPRVQESWKAAATLYDHFSIDLVKHTVS